MPATRGVTCTVAARLGQRAAEWDALVEAAPLPSPFLRSWWVEATTPSGAHLLVTDGDRLVGGLALRSDRLLGVRRLRFAGQGVLCPDHLDLLALPGHEEAVSAALRAWFDGRGQRLLDLTGLPEDARLPRALGLRTTVVDTAPYQALPARAEDYLASRSSNFRRSVRRADRRLLEAGFAHRRATTASLRADLEAFHALHDDREGRAALLAALPVLGRALEEGVACGEARVDVLESPAAGPIAVSVAFQVAGRVSLYQVARSLEHDHRSAGTVLLHRVVTDAIDAGCSEVDLLRGGEDYKSSFADHARTVGRVRAGHGLAAKALLTAWGLAARTRGQRDRLSARRTPPGP